jgi:penicillin-binding protein 1C
MAPPAESRLVFDRRACYLTADVLSDPNARTISFGYESALDFPFKVAVKTGTSTDFRDSWALGYTPEFTVGVWAGNFDGSPMKSISGIYGAAPILRDVIFALHHEREAVWYHVPDTISRELLCQVSGKIASKDCLKKGFDIGIGGQSVGTCDNPECLGSSVTGKFKINYPHHRDEFLIDPNLPPDYQKISLKVSAPLSVQRIRWFIDGELFAEVDAPFTAQWPLRKGTHTIIAKGGTFKDSVVVKVH